MNKGVTVGEDISSQVKSSMQWLEGTVNYPNSLSRPNQSDLSQDRIDWSLRSPGAAILPIPGLLIGLSIGTSIQLSLLSLSVIGGIGWLKLFVIKVTNHSLISILSIMLGLGAGNSITSYSTANIILYALVPWVILWSLRIADIKDNKINFYIIGFFLFICGTFVFVKTSGVVVAGTLGAFLFFSLLNKYDKSNRKMFIVKFFLLSLLFFSSFIFQEIINYKLSGQTAQNAYSNIVSSIEVPLTGNYWIESTQGPWLLFSLIASLGYSMPARSLAINCRDLGKQFPDLSEWLNQNMINEHVFIAGLISILFTFILLFEFRKSIAYLDSHTKILLLCFLSIPFIGFGILSFKFKWNYLLYHSHTTDFAIILILPIFFSIWKAEKLSLNSFLFIAFFISLPITNQLKDIFISNDRNKESNGSLIQLSNNLSNSRFTKAIDLIEEDSKNPLDILFFLPSGDSGDLILRSKMRILTTHFSADNFPNFSKFITKKSLTVYFAFDTGLNQNLKFRNAFIENFPQAISQEIIYNSDVSVMKVFLDSSNQNS